MEFIVNILWAIYWSLCKLLLKHLKSICAVVCWTQWSSFSAIFSHYIYACMYVCIFECYKVVLRPDTTAIPVIKRISFWTINRNNVIILKQKPYDASSISLFNVIAFWVTRMRSNIYLIIGSRSMRPIIDTTPYFHHTYKHKNNTQFSRSMWMAGQTFYYRNENYFRICLTFVCFLMFFFLFILRWWIFFFPLSLTFHFDFIPGKILQYFGAMPNPLCWFWFRRMRTQKHRIIYLIGCLFVQKNVWIRAKYANNGSNSDFISTSLNVIALDKMWQFSR